MTDSTLETPSPRFGPAPTWARLVVLLLFAAMAWMRLVHIDADPPQDLDWSGGVFFDEGMLAHDARERVLFGRAPVDDWSDVYVSPVLSYLKRATFVLFGVGIAQVRLVPVAFSLATLALVYFLAKHANGWRFGILAMCLLGFAHVFAMFNRVGLTETSVLFVMVLAAFFWLEAWARLDVRTGTATLTNASLVCFAAAGASTFLSYVWKSYPSFLTVPFVALLVLTRRRPTGANQLPPRAAAAAAAAIVLGALLVALPWYVLFVRRYAPQIHQAMQFYESQSIPTSLRQLVANVVELSFFRVFARDPAMLYLAAGYLGLLIHRSFHAPERLVPFDVFFGLWFVAHFAFDAILNYQPVRYHVPVMPAMSILMARAIAEGARLRALPFPPRLRWVAFPFLWIWLALFTSHLPLPFDVLWRQLAGARARPPSGAQVLAFWLVAAAAVLLALTLIGRFVRRREIALPRLVAPALLGVAPLVCFAAIEGRDYLEWVMHPKHLVRDRSHELGARLHDRWIAGLAAPELALENRLHALHVYPSFFNDHDLFGRFPITHLLLDSHQREQTFYFATYPETMRRAVLIDAFPLASANFVLLSLAEPFVERTESPTAVAGDPTSFTASARIVNPPRGDAREVQLGWTLIPETPPGTESPPPRITGPPSEPILLAPGASHDFPIRGVAPPGTSHLLAYVLPPHRATLAARFFDHESGALEPDPDAEFGEAWHTGVAAGRKAYALYGPYLQFGPGRIHTYVRLRSGRKKAAGAIARIEVARGMGRGVLWSRELTSNELVANGPYTVHELEYLHDQTQNLEFRVYTFGRADLWVDRVTIEYAPGAPADGTIVVPSGPT